MLYCIEMSYLRIGGHDAVAISWDGSLPGRLPLAGVHLLEIDLLRRGVRALAHPRVPDTAYLIALTRAQSGATAIWPLGLRDVLPEIPIPLRAPDGDGLLELGPALAAIYDEAGYDLSIDYREPPPPPARSPADAAWVHTLHDSALP
jgi:hypothetical protein